MAPPERPRPDSSRHDRARGPVPIGESLERWRRLAGVGAPSTMSAITQAWPEVMGPLADDVEPRALIDGTLLVAAREPAAVEAMRWRAESVATALSGRLGSSAVQRIEVRLEGRSRRS